MKKLRQIIERRVLKAVILSISLPLVFGFSLSSSGLTRGSFVGVAQAAAGVPTVISYQGRLADSSGNLLGTASGTIYFFKFSIWDATSAGTKLWPSSAAASTSASVVSGVFNVNIGDTPNGYPQALDFNFEDNDTVFLQVEVASSSNGTYEAVTPRQRIASAAYALNAKALRGFVPSQLASGSNVPVLNSGNLNLGGVNPQINATGTNRLVIQGGTGTGDLVLATNGGKVGVGTAVPSSTLHVVGTAQVSATSTFGIGNGQSFITYDANGPLLKGNSGSSYFTLDNSASVGNYIALKSNSGVDFLNSTGEAQQRFAGTVLHQQSGGMINWANGSTVTVGVDLGIARNAAGILEINNGSAGTFRDLTVRRVIGSATSTFAGNVGIGTTAPSSTLHVMGLGQFGTNAGHFLTVGNGEIRDYYQDLSSGLRGTITLGAGGGTDIVFQPNSTGGVVRIDNGGNAVFVGGPAAGGTVGTFTIRPTAISEFGGYAAAGRTLNLVGGEASDNGGGTARNGGDVLIDGGLPINAGTAGNVLLGSVRGKVAVGSSTAATLLSVATSTNIFNVTSAGRVGIGTSTPATALHINAGFGGLVNGIKFGTGGGLYAQSTTELRFEPSEGSAPWVMGWDRLYSNAYNGPGIFPNSSGPVLIPAGSDPDTGLGWISADKQALYSGGTAMLTIATTTVGIGTTVPSSTLHVVSPTASVGIQWTQSAGWTGNITSDTTTTFRPTRGYLTIQDSDGYTYHEGAVGAGVIPTARLHSKGSGTTSSTIPFRVENSASSQLLVVRDDGTIGISTAVPSSTLHVVGTSRFTATSSFLGNVGISNTNPTAALTIGGTPINAGGSVSIRDNSGAVWLERSSNVAEASIDFARSKGSIGSESGVVDGDYLGSFNFRGRAGDGSYGVGAGFGALVSGTPGVNDMPSSLFFATTPDGSGFWQERMRIDSTGKVGIGTTVPSSTLHVFGSGATLRVTDPGNDGIELQGGSGPRIKLGSNSSLSAYMEIGAYNGINNIDTKNRDLRVQTNVASSALFVAASTSRVGIGTDVPSSTLHVVGDATISGTVNATLIQNASGDLSIRSHSSNSIWFGFPNDGHIAFNWGQSAIMLPSDYQYKWFPNAGNPPSGSADLGLARNAVGILRVSNGTTGLGGLVASSTIIGANNTPSSTLHVVGSFQVTATTTLQGTTIIDNLSLGATSFEADAGILTWVDMPVTASSSAGTKEAYIAQIDGNPLLTVYSEADGSGGTQNRRVGIATAVPSSTLHVVGGFEVASSTGKIIYATSSTNRVGIGTDVPSSTLHVVGTFQVSSTALYVSSTTGRVGIGTASPDYALRVANGSVAVGPNAGDQLVVANTGLFRTGGAIAIESGADINIRPADGGSSGVRVYDPNFITGTSGQKYTLRVEPTYNQTSGSAANTDLLINRTETAIGSGAQYLLDAQVGGTSKFRVTNTGQGYFANNVGIGTVSPSSTLHVIGGFEVASSTGKIIYATSSTNRVGIGTATPSSTLHVVGDFTVTATTTLQGQTTIDDLTLGALTFESDSGIISWIDMPVTSNATTSAVQSYSAQIDGNPLLTIYSESDGAGGTQNRRVGIATTTPTNLLTVGPNAGFNLNAFGDLLAGFEVLNATTTASATSTSATTTLTVATSTNFNVGNYVLVNTSSTYAKITAISGTTLTISPALTWNNGALVTEMHIPEVGADNIASTTTRRYGRGYFLDGIVTGNGTTYFTDRGISVSSGDLSLTAGAGSNLVVSASSLNLTGSLRVAGNSTVNNTVVDTSATGGTLMPQAPCPGATFTGNNIAILNPAAVQPTTNDIFYNSTRGLHSRITSVALCAGNERYLTLTDAIAGQVGGDAWTVYTPVADLGNATSAFYNRVYAVNYLGLASTLTGGFDVAEEYPTADESLEAGDIVSTDPIEPLSIRKAQGDSTAFVGIISTNPGLTFGNAKTGVWRKVALTGRVPVKISFENGTIEPGDYLTASRTRPGYAVKMIESGQTIGMALERAAEDIEKVMVQVRNGWQQIGPLAVGSVNLQNNTGGYQLTPEMKIVVRAAQFGEDALGQAEIEAGVTRVDVSFSQAYENLPIVTVTPTTLGDFRYAVTATTGSGFAIVMSAPQAETVGFNWHAFESAPTAKIFVSSGSTRLVNITVVESPVPAPAPAPEPGEVAGESIDEEERPVPAPAPEPEAESVPEPTPAEGGA